MKDKCEHMKACHNCYYRIVSITRGDSLRCMYDLHKVSASHVCPSWKEEFKSVPKEGTDKPKKGKQRAAKNTKNKSEQYIN